MEHRESDEYFIRLFILMVVVPLVGSVSIASLLALILWLLGY